MLDDLGQLNQIRHRELGDPEILARISQYEMAFRMQTSAPELADVSNEPSWVFDLYGPDSRRPGTYAYNCLLARRMAERGVRFTQLFHRGWDQHSSLPTHLANQCRDTDQASAALISDLKQRGLLDDTLVIWGGEFGRTVYSQGEIGSGRDHHGRCFSLWLAGGGVKGGISHGQTDDFSYNIAENPVHIRDLNATILHCLGMDHNRFTFRFQGLNQKPTGVETAHVVKGILS
jgi:arylsulfatase A-like enzyme